MNTNTNTTRGKIGLGLLLVLVVAASGCASLEDTNADKKAQELGEQTGANTVTDSAVGTAYWLEQKTTEAIQQQLIKANPIPNVEQSLERENLKRKFDVLNDRDKVFHVYLVSYGKVMAYYTAQGKVSSVNSKLTNPEQVWRIPGCDEHNSGNNCWVTTDAPQLDGSYGSNGDGKFFFTTDGAYVESNLKYIVSERQLNIRDQVQLTKEVE